MTPEEARQIDRQEFAAECAASLERALAYSKRCRELDRKIFTDWIAGDNNRDDVHRLTTPAKAASAIRGSTKAIKAKAAAFTAFGETHIASVWAAKSGIGAVTISSRIANGWSVEDAVTIPAGLGKHGLIAYRNGRLIRRISEAFRPTRGVVPSFLDSPGTGVGRHARDLQSAELNG